MAAENKAAMNWEAAVTWLIDQPDKQDVVRAGYYDSPLISAANRYWQSGEWKAARSYLPAVPGLALDIGAGRGIASYALAKDGWQVKALEPDPSNLVGVGAIKSLAQSENLPISVVQEFGEKLPFPDGHFDLVLARQVLHHAYDLGQLCKEVSRVLKPGGRFIAMRDHVLFRKADLGKFLNSHPLHYLYGGENAYLLREYVAALDSAPLEVEHVLRSFETPIHYDDGSFDAIGNKLKSRMDKTVVLRPISSFLVSDKILPRVLRRLGKFDIRPGSAASFICRKKSSV